jgi:hypothetical protein
MRPGANFAPAAEALAALIEEAAPHEIERKR